jgi:CubicO group peptidase (beta-lactamase class C family)
MAQPGERWFYNTGSYVLGALIERTCRAPLGDFMHERIFEPLHMIDTGFFVPPAKVSRLVTAYRRSPRGLVSYDASAQSAWAVPPAFADGGAGVVSTVDDYFRFSRMLLGRGDLDGKRVLAPSSVAAMTTNHLTPTQIEDGRAVLGAGRGWGYGLFVVQATTPEGVPPGAFGWAGGLGTTWTADPRSQTSAILMTQTLFDSPEHPAVHKGFVRQAFEDRGAHAG